MGRELTGALAIGPDIAPVLVEGGSSKQVVTEQREELCQALLPHPDQMARPVIAYMGSLTRFKQLGSFHCQD